MQIRNDVLAAMLRSKNDCLLENASADAMDALHQKVGENAYKKSGEEVFDVSKDSGIETKSSGEALGDAAGDTSDIDASALFPPTEDDLIADGELEAPGDDTDQDADELEQGFGNLPPADEIDWDNLDLS